LLTNAKQRVAVSYWPKPIGSSSFTVVPPNDIHCACSV
jgi:hypothetical protein